MTEVSKLKFRIEPLDKKHDRTAFSCGNTPLDRYLHEQAGQDQRRNVAASFVLTEVNKRIVFGYYTLSAFSVNLGDLPQNMARKLARYPNVPTTLIGRLVVDLKSHGQRFGEFLLMDALYRCLYHANEVASFAVVVDAIDDQARAFYEHYDFLPLPRHRNRLFLPMQTIGQLF